MKKNNKKGFTLVELLAVIVILAVVVLIAMTAVVPQMNKARVESFITEANKFVQGATNYYTDSQLSGTGMASNGGCVLIQTLIDNGYIDKKDENNAYQGYVTVDATTSPVSYTISISNGSFFTGTSSTAASALTPDQLVSTNIQTGTVTASVPSGLTCN